MRSDSILTASKEVAVVHKEETCCLPGELDLYSRPPQQSHFIQEKRGLEGYMEVEGKEVKRHLSRSQQVQQ